MLRRFWGVCEALLFHTGALDLPTRKTGTLNNDGLSLNTTIISQPCISVSWFCRMYFLLHFHFIKQSSYTN